VRANRAVDRSRVSLGLSPGCVHLALPALVWIERPGNPRTGIDNARGSRSHDLVSTSAGSCACRGAGEARHE